MELTTAQYLNRKPVLANVVRRLDGRTIVIVKRYRDGTIDYRYEDDRLNVVHNTLEDFCS